MSAPVIFGHSKLFMLQFNYSHTSYDIKSAEITSFILTKGGGGLGDLH